MPDPKLHIVTNPRSLDDLRPRSFEDLEGNESVKLPLEQQMENGSIPKRTFLHGPSGAGKTSTARILSAFYFCLRQNGSARPCGECANCLSGLDQILDYQQLTGTQLEERWEWWKESCRSILWRDLSLLFIDEAQDLSEKHQKAFHDDLEVAKATVIFATTHRHRIDDALVNRFDPNVYEMRRPTQDQTLKRLRLICDGLNVVADDFQLVRVAQHYSCDMRKCVNLVYAARLQTKEGIITDEYLDVLLGNSKTTDRSAIGRGGRRRPKL